MDLMGKITAAIDAAKLRIRNNVSDLVENPRARLEMLNDQAANYNADVQPTVQGGELTNRPLTPEEIEQKSTDLAMAVMPMGVGHIAYHGSPREFGKFSPDAPKSTSGGFNVHGVSVSPSEKVARRYAEDFSIGGKHGNVYKVDTATTKPLNLENLDFHSLQRIVKNIDSGAPLSEMDDIGLEVLMKKYGMKYDAKVHPIEAIKSSGFDSITSNIANPRAGTMAEAEHLVFDPEMIRILEQNGKPTGARPWTPGEWGSQIIEAIKNRK